MVKVAIEVGVVVEVVVEVGVGVVVGIVVGVKLTYSLIRKTPFQLTVNKLSHACTTVHIHRRLKWHRKIDVG